ncbi:natural killer cells antigen CD94-like isoform X2 [Eleginops maclovinus]|uniref:natural killer cells antigen CD94-like isoform X2 n=1 Tax=Eleginops maclovinus TaxID=56733 RepID=UPI00308073E6
MDLRNEEEEAERETPAVAGCCHTCQLTTRVAVVMTTTFLIMGLLMGLIFFVTWTRAPGVGQTALSSHELMERLQQCQREHQEVNLMLHTVTQDSRCSVCPGGWLCWRSHCYFFSVGLQDDRGWSESAEFCLQHNSSLAVIKDPAEMFIQGVMSKLPHFPYLWVGLTDAQQEGQWLWGDGEDVQQYMPVTVEWDADDRDCADLRGGGRLFASSCETDGPWACKRES